MTICVTLMRSSATEEEDAPTEKIMLLLYTSLTIMPDSDSSFIPLLPVRAIASSSSSSAKWHERETRHRSSRSGISASTESPPSF